MLYHVQTRYGSSSALPSPDAPEAAIIHAASGSRPILWGILCGLGAYVIGLCVSLTAVSQRVEHACLDLSYRYLGAPSRAKDDIVLLLVDSKSLLAMRTMIPGDEEPWPWRRLFYGAVVDFLRNAGAAAVAIDLDFSGPSENDPGDSDETAALFGAWAHTYLSMSFKQLTADRTEVDLGQLDGLLEPIDRILARQKASATVEVEEVARLRFEDRRYDHVQVPYGPLSREGAARRLGTVNAIRDEGGSIRRTPLLVRFQESLYPSLALSVFLDMQGAKRLTVTRGGRLLLEGGSSPQLSVPLDPSGWYLLNWYGPEQTFPSFTIHEAIRMALADYAHRYPKSGAAKPLYWYDEEFAKWHSPEEIDAYAERFRGKVVFIGVNASELGDVWSNPFSRAFPGVEVHATALANLLHRQMLERVPFGGRAAVLLGLTLVLAIATALVGGETRGLIAFLAVLAGYAGLFAYCFRRHLIWLDLATPILAGVLAYGSVTLVQYFTTGRLRRQLRRTFDKVVAPDLVNLLLDEPDWLLRRRGETRNLTVLFSDLENFTTLAESLEAPVLVESINEYFSAFTDVILRHRAYLDKYIGDSVMAVWGAPVSDENHAVNGCLAALELKKRLSGFAWSGLESDGPLPFTRIGINSGDMVVGMVGGEGVTRYTVMGDNVVVASRLEGANKVYHTQVLIGEECYRQASREILAREVDMVVLKGKRQPLKIYEPVCRVGELTDEARRQLDAYALGLRLYRERKWQEASEAFRQVLEMDRHDGPARVLEERCRAYEREEPLSTWKGEYIMLGK